MNRIKPNELRANRVYFTEFDRVTYSQVAWTPDDVEGIRLGLVRKLKLLALLKGHVVIAASHLLESELAREVILPHPQLFSEHIVVPALRAEYSTCEAFLEAKRRSSSQGESELYRGVEQQDMAQLIDDTALAVEWNTVETSSWFKSRLLADLRNANSLVGLMLAGKGLRVPKTMCTQLEEESFLARGAVYNAAQQHGNLDFREIICSYTDFLYYLSGARAVHSEGILPQENIIDFRLSDLGGSKTLLSEHEVFFKIFVDIVKSATSTYFPTDLLDALTIEDAISLHRIALEEKFIGKYNAIQEMTKAGLEMADPDRLVFLMKELEGLEQGLRREYQQAIGRELPARFRQLMQRRTANFVHALASLIVTPYGILVGAKDILVSGLRLLSLGDLAETIDTRVGDGLRTLGAIVEKTAGLEKPIFLNFVDELRSRYARSIFGPEK